MQFVWMYWAEGAQGQELLHSMRSVEKHYKGENLKITLVGDKPDWYHGHHLPCPRIKPNGSYTPFRDNLHKTLHACFSEEVNEEWIWMADDVYFVQDVTREEVIAPRYSKELSRGNVESHSRKNRWQRIKRASFYRLEDANPDIEVMYDYATHMPRHVVSSDLIAIAVKYNLANDYANWEVLYGNHFYKNPKPLRPFFNRVGRARSLDWWRRTKTKAKIINHVEKAYNEEFESFLKETFPDKGSFEFPQTTIINSPKTIAPPTKTGPKLDFVYPYIKSALNGRELQLSIESVKKFYNGKASITVIGDRPEWLIDNHIPMARVKPGPNQSFRDTYNKLMAAVKTAQIGKEFVWMHDDVFFTRPLTYEEISIGRYASERTVQDLENWNPSNKWLGLKKKTMLEIAKKKGSAKDYATHMPHLVVKRLLTNALRAYDLSKDMYLWEIIYQNYRDQEGVKIDRDFFYRTTRAVNELEKYRDQPAKIMNNGNHGWCDEWEEFLKERINGNRRYNEPAGCNVLFVEKPRAFAVIPFSPRDSYRVRNLEYVKKWAEGIFDGVVIVETHPDSTFNKSKQVNRGVEELNLGPDDVICIQDADCIGSEHMMKTAINEARTYTGLVYPYDALNRLCPADTRYFLRRGHRKINEWTAPRPKKRHAPGGVTLVSKRNWDILGGMDPRFIENGAEDNAFRNLARNKLGREKRIEGTLVHLWHPRENIIHPKKNYRIWKKEYRGLPTKTN